MKFFLIVLLAAEAIAAPFSGFKVENREAEEECSKKFTRFRHGKEFSYKYIGETVSGVNSSSSATSALKIVVHRCIIQTVGKCQHVLKINQAELWEAQSKTPRPLKYQLSKGTLAFARELAAHDLYFRSDRGVIKDLSPADGEKPDVLNIKKGILSALQVQFTEDHAEKEETDVAGNCKVRYHVHSKYITGRAKVVSKSRNLTECTERSKTDIGIHIHQYNEKSLSLLTSTGSCRYILSRKAHVQKVVCEEKHLFRPFSAGYKSPSGAFTTTRQVLQLLNVHLVSVPQLPSFDASRSPLTFEHIRQRSDGKDIYTVEQIITRLARESMEETKPESARLFSRLVLSLRKLKPKAVELVWERVFECDRSGVCLLEEKDKFQMYLLDSLPHCGTTGCAKVMSHAIKHQLINGERGNMFLTGLALVSVPTEDMIGHVLEMCQARPSRTGMLTLGTLIHKFCEDNRCDELQDYQSPVILAERWLQGLLSGRCEYSTLERAEEILIALKAIGNAGRPSSAQDIILQCAVNPNLPTNMTIAALESLRRMPCSQDVTERLLNIYGQPVYDVEIRIAAYLALVKCPSVELYKRITAIQRIEVNNQVGSFVWSHVTNAMDSTEPVDGLPVAVMIRKALGGQVLREFNLNRLRFSRAWEGSFYNEILRAGGSVQGHLIYHPNSFFPRSTHLNVTVDVLGASINVLDAAARFEGFEILLEQFFGTGGYFPDKRVMEMFNLKPHEERDKDEKDVNGVPIRGRRSINDDVNKVESQLNKLNKKMDIRKHTPSGAVSVKLFGNEMRLASFDDINWLQTEADNINMVDLLIKLARGGKKTFSKSFMFLDAETTVPTMLGLPLKLSAKGTAVVSVEMAGKFDIRNMFWGPMAFDVRGHLKPSAVVEVVGRMGVDAIFAEAGVLVNSSVYTSTEMRGNGTYKQGQMFKFELAAPKKPIQIFNVSSSIFVTLNDVEVKIDGAKRRFEPAPCLNITRVLGIAVCGRLSLPVAFRDYESPFFPLSGSASFSLSVIPTDPKLRVYQILAQRLPTKDENKYDIMARISTPHATWKREFAANGSLWLKKQEQIFSISTSVLGYRFGKLEGSYNNNTNALNLTFSTRDVIYGNRIVLNGQYFNNTDTLTRSRRMGGTWSATYKNYTVRQLTEIYNKSRTYGFVSNTTYWPGKYIFANGELSIPKKSVQFLANHTCTKTSFCINGSLGEEENKFFFNFTNKPTKISIQTTGRYIKSQKEAVMKTYILPYKQSFSMRSSYVNKGVEKGVHIKASHDNKNRVFTWYTGVVNSIKEKSLKANTTILGRPMEAIWTFFNYTSEKGLKFNGSAMGKSIATAFTYLKKENEKTLKFNASCLNRKAEAMWSYLNLGTEKSLKFNATALNKTVSALWSYLNLGTEKNLKFNATALNKTVSVLWSYLSNKNTNILKFNASALNKTVEAVWRYAKIDNVRKLSFRASALNKTIESALTFLNITNKKILKVNATVLNTTVEALWTLFNISSEKGLRFDVNGLNKSANILLSFIDRPEDKALKFNSTVLNKTVEAMWSYMNRGQQRFAKFNVSALNKTAEALWTYFSFASEKGLKFNITGLNKTMETVWTYFNKVSEKGLKFNATVMKRSVNATLTYFKFLDNMGVRFNASAFNRTVELMSKILMEKKGKKLVISGTYQKYTVSLVGLFQNLTMRKSLCMHPEYLGRVYGRICATFLNSSSEKLVAFNVSALNRTAEIKSQWFKKPTECAHRFTAKLNKTIYMESWLSFQYTQDLKTLQMNTTIANRSVDARWFFEKRIESSKKILGFNLTAFNRTMGVRTHIINQDRFKEASAHLMWNNSDIFSSALRFHNLTKEKILKFRNRIGSYVGEIKGEYIFTEGGEKKDFVLVRMLRNGSKIMFYDTTQLSYQRKQGRRLQIQSTYSLRVLGRSFSYGWEFEHLRNSNDKLTHNQFKVGIIYSKGKRVSATSIYRSDANELSKLLIVEYLPGKTMQHSITWYKQRNLVVTTWELLPRIPLTHRLEWNKDDGFFIRSITSGLGTSTSSYFRFVSSSDSYDGKLEIWPQKALTFRGRFSRKNGLLITSTINALGKEWTQKIDFNRKERKILISVEPIPQVPVVLEAQWDMAQGLRINTELSAFTKSLKWEGFYETLTKTWTSDFTILKEKIVFIESLDVNTKTFTMSVKVRNRKIGFVGRFDWKAYVASAYLICNKYKTGWFLKLDTKARNIIYNVTLTSTISGQIAAEMPNDKQLQVTFQRKLGVNVVNESRLIYQLTPKASRIFVTWNTTTVKYLVGQVKSLRPLIINAATNVYSLTSTRAKNLTNELQKMVKTLEGKIKPSAMKVYLQVKNYNFKGLYKNVSIVAQNLSVTALNMTAKAYNMSIKAFKMTVKNLPMLARNATLLYKKIRAELKTRIPLIVGNVTLYLKNISIHVKNITRDLTTWGLNVTQMIGDIKIRDQKIIHIAQRLVKKLNKLSKELSKNITVQLKKLQLKVREIQVRKVKLGPLADKYMMKIRSFTCNFNVSCTLRNVGIIVRKIILKVKNVNVLNKTIEQHIVLLQKRASILSQNLTIFAKKLTKMAPHFLRNATIKAIHLVRNLTKDAQNMTKHLSKKVRLMLDKAALKVQRYTKPLTNLVVKVTVAIYNRAKPAVLTYIERAKPIVHYLVKLKKGVILFNEPLIKPLGPMATDVMYQLLNITVHKMPLGVVLDKAIKVSVEEGTKVFKLLNHTLTTNITAVIRFISDLSKKTPEQIVDITIMKVSQLVNATKMLVNQTIQQTYNTSRKALAAYNESIKAINKTIFRILNMRPEDFVEISITKIYIFAKNMTILVKNITAEIQNITKQIWSLDFVTPSQKAWQHMNLIDRYASLQLKVKLEKIVQNIKGHIKALNLKEHATAIKNRVENYRLVVLKELKEIGNVGYSAFKLTMRFGRMDITREEFVEELLAIAKAAKGVVRKHFYLAKNTSFELYGVHQRYWRITILAARGYKTITVQRAKDTYQTVKKYLADFYKEHQSDSEEAYNFYKTIALEVYDVVEKEALVLKGKALVLKGKMTKEVDLLKAKLINKIESLIHKLRQYENMTYEEIGLKVYKLSKDFGLALYKNYSVKAKKLYSDTKILALRTYELNRAMTIKYYNLSRIHAVRIFNNTKNFTITYYNISKNMTIRAYHLSRNMTLKVYNMTRNLTIRSIEYLNKTVKPQIIKYYAKGKIIAVKAYNDGIDLGKKSIENVKTWYKENKEKTVEELYGEVYGVVNKQVDKVVRRIQLEMRKVNKTIMAVSMEVVSIYNQTKNVSIIASKQLVAIFYPYANTARNKTMMLIFKIMNVSVPLLKKAKNLTLVNLEKAKNLTLLNIQKAKNFTIELYRNITNRKDFKEFMAKYQVKERYNRMISRAKEMREWVVRFIKETRPKVEAKLKKAVYYLNVTLPGLIKQKREEIMANPKEYLKKLYTKAVMKVRQQLMEAIKDTSAEAIIMHEIWGEYVEEIKQHEIVEAGKDLYYYSKEKVSKAVAKLVEKVKELELKLKEKVKELKQKFEELKQKFEELKSKAKAMVAKAKTDIRKGFDDFKKMKIREIVEHRLVFKTIELVKKAAVKVKNITRQAKKLTLKWVAIVKVYYKNMTIKAKKYEIIVKRYILVIKKKYTLALDKYKPIALNYTLKVKKIAIKSWKIARTYVKVKFNATRMWMNKTIEKGIKIYKEKVVPYFNNKIIPFYKNKVVPAYKKYSSLTIQFSKNLPKRAYNYTINSRLYKLTVKNYKLTASLLRDASKMTIRESVLKLRNVTIIAYNYTVKLTKRAVNMTKLAVKLGLQKYNVTKVYLVRLANNTVASIKPLIPILNYTKNEFVEIVIYINKYYGIEDKARAHVNRQYATLQEHYVKYQKHAAKIPGMLNSSAYRTAYGALDFINNTIRYINRTIGVMNETMIKFRLAVPKYVQIKDGVVTLIIPHPRPITGTVKSICRDACNKVKNMTYKAINMTRKAVNMTKMYAKLYSVRAMRMAKVWKQVAYKKTMILRMKAYNLTMKVYYLTMKYPRSQKYMNTTIHYFNITRKFVKDLNFTKIANMTKTYAPVVYKLAKEWSKIGFNATRNMTIHITNIAWNITVDIYNSTSLKEALGKARNHSMKAYNETLKLYHVLYKKTMIKYTELNKTVQELRKTLIEHEFTQRYLRHSREYYGHSRKIMKARTRQLHHLKKYWHRRISHKLNHVKKLLTPRNWIPPFNSTAMIFGKPHVYTFDNTYYKFPGYNKPDCTYVLARDVRDDKLTLLSQEEALILITKDGNVKIHSDGRVESMIKIDAQGKKIQDGYNSELPVQTADMTVTREGPLIVLRHNLGLEILCDMEHNLCTFNIDRWFHGRLAGLLGTNNNEAHDDMMMPNHKLAKNIIDFVNSWEVSRDRECQIRKHRVPTSKCAISKYSSRCRELFKGTQSPLAPYFNITNPRPFLEACESDYADCDTKTAKDMKHCNSTAAYIELLRMKGEWVDFLPECGRCQNHEMGHTWFQRAHKMVDVVIIVPETQGMRGFAKKIPSYITELKEDLAQYSFRFGLVSFGGKGIHKRAHVVTVNGKYFGKDTQVQNAIEHLKFSDTPDNETSDAFEAIAKATRHPFRAGATKIILLLTSTERVASPGSPCVRRMTKKLQMQDITLNIIGKYRKLSGQIIGQDYRGKVFYRKQPRGFGSRGVALPEGEYIELMKNTKGSVIGLSSFASDYEKRSRAVGMTTVIAWREQIKRDQKMCKECFCARGLVGEGRSICKINEFHKC